MHTIILKLFPSRLANPNLDIRYVLPDLLVEKSEGQIEDGGYDYEAAADTMLIYLLTEDLERAIGCITDLVEGTQVLGNDLKEGMEIVIES
jgi:hypothetical protein